VIHLTKQEVRLLAHAVDLMDGELVMLDEFEFAGELEYVAEAGGFRADGHTRVESLKHLIKSLLSWKRRASEDAGASPADRPLWLVRE